jgi:hypothetical protein
MSGMIRVLLTREQAEALAALLQCHNQDYDSAYNKEVGQMLAKLGKAMLNAKREKGGSDE